MRLINYPEIIPRSKQWKVTVNSEPAEILSADFADFLHLSIAENETVKVNIKVNDGDLSQTVIRPFSKNIKAETGKDEITFAIDKTCDLFLDIPG